MKRIISILKFIIPLIVINAVNAESIEELTLKMGQKLGDYTVLNEAVTRGGMRVRLCQYCHGKDGNSVKDNIPNLAAQNPIYLLTQFEHFRTGHRKNRVMNDLAKGLTIDERVNIALYYASRDVKTPDALKVNTNSVSYQRGQKLYKNVCSNCHGANGHGKETLPRVAGQKFKFVTKTLRAYKNKTGTRPNSPMTAVAAVLNEQDIESIATFINTMK